MNAYRIIYQEQPVSIKYDLIIIAWRKVIKNMHENVVLKEKEGQEDHLS